jgi:hypothetical protein
MTCIPEIDGNSFVTIPSFRNKTSLEKYFMIYQTLQRAIEPLKLL